MFQLLVTRALENYGINVGGDQPGDIQVKNPRFYRRAAIFGSLGVGDSYADGDITVDLEAFFETLMREGQKKRIERLRVSGKGAHNRALPKSLPEAWIAFQSLFINQQSVKRAKRVGKRHYDIGNDLYRQMLGPMMAYSCGYWAGAKTLDEAQRNKYRHICEKIGLEKREKGVEKNPKRVLEIGCGWGGFAAYAAANYYVEIVGVSISKEQIRYASKAYSRLCAEGGIGLHFMDFRDVPKAFPEAFDAMVSIGMFEHVGADNYDEYFRIAWLALKPGGIFLLHSIIGSGGVDPFIWYRIFPGGVLPTEEQIERATKPYFVREYAENFGFDYSRTLKAWWENFLAAWPQLKESGRYDDRFFRMWEFYLKSCSVSFKTRRIQLNQYVFKKLDPKQQDEGYQWNRPHYSYAT